MDSWWLALLREQLAARFADFAGAHASATIPVSDRFATRIVSERLPPSSAVRDITVRASAGNVITVALRLAKPAFLPRFEIPIHIEAQPNLPDQPAFVFRVVLPRALAAMAGPALRIFDVLPPGLRMRDDRLIADLRVLLQQYQAAEALDYVERLELTTVEGAILLRIDARVPPPAMASGVGA
jgi:hypothetical protein